METSSPILPTLLMGMVAIGCNGESSNRSGAREIANQLVDVSCGQCQFGMEGDGCELAIRHEGKSYFVSGSSIDDHGDAHADDGFCNCVRQAQVSGTIRDGTFHVQRIEVFDVAPRSD